MYIRRNLKGKKIVAIITCTYIEYKNIKKYKKGVGNY